MNYRLYHKGQATIKVHFWDFTPKSKKKFERSTINNSKALLRSRYLQNTHKGKGKKIDEKYSVGYTTKLEGKKKVHII